MIEAAVVIVALLLFSLIGRSVNKVTEIADESNTKEGYGCAILFALLMIPFILAIGGVALNETVPNDVPGSDRAQIRDVVGWSTPQPPNAQPATDIFGSTWPATMEARREHNRNIGR